MFYLLFYTRMLRVVAEVWDLVTVVNYCECLQYREESFCNCLLNGAENLRFRRIDSKSTWSRGTRCYFIEQLYMKQI